MTNIFADFRHLVVAALDDLAGMGSRRAASISLGSRSSRRAIPPMAISRPTRRWCSRAPPKRTLWRSQSGSSAQPGASSSAAIIAARRVKIEAPEQALASLRPFVESLRATCRLQPTGLTKYEAGVLTAGLDVLPDDFGATTIEPDAPIGRVALAVLRRHFEALRANEPGARLGDDIEELHDMRVASRRLRAAMSLFADVLRLQRRSSWMTSGG